MKLTLTAVFAAVVALQSTNAAIDCNNWSTRYKKFIDGVCICNATATCDSFPTNYTTLTSSQAGLYRSSRDGERFRYELLTLASGSSSDADLTMDASTTYQTILGFGGAFTDAAAINLYKLSSALQTKALDAYYSTSGIGYSMGRIPIASTDFSTSIYSYDDTVGDLSMSKFSIAVDKTSNKINLIKRALSTSTTAKRNVSLFASSWAPPVWMTEENSTLNCHLIGDPGTSYWEALALYYSNFVTAYESELGKSLWGMTVQNEPNDPGVYLNAWQSLRLTTEEERDFIKKDLGPILKKNHPNLKLIILDDNKNHLLDWTAALDDADAAQYIDGVGIHWYSNYDFPLGYGGNFDTMKTFHEQYPDVFLLGTEACEGYLPDILVTSTGAGVKLTNFNTQWWRGHNYAKDIINDLNSYASGWMDWNLFLDTSGGPNWAGNYVDSPILVDEANGAEFYKQPMYYVMGHFSKFLTPGSVRIAITAASGSTSKLADIDYTAFVTPEGYYVVVLFNKESSVQTIKVLTPGSKLVSVTVKATSIQTLVFKT
jgi:glucosylceramidase